MEKEIPGISPEQILRELYAIAMARATDYLEIRDGVLEIKSTGELPEGRAAAIASVERTSTGLRVKFYDKLKALELMGKHFGLFEPKTARQDTEDNNLLQAILDSTRGDLDICDLQELQQAPAACHDLVEQAGNKTL